MRKIVVCLLVLIGLFSCKENDSKQKFSNDLIDLICAEKIKQKKLFDSKSKTQIKTYYSIEIFVKLNNEKFVETDFQELLDVYEKSFKTKFDTYNQFMYKVINGDFALNENELGEKSFYLDKALKKEFENVPFDVFLKKYSFRKKDDKKLYLKHDSFSGNKYLTISYLLYTKGRYLGSGCLGEGTAIYKFEDLLNIKKTANFN